MQIITGDETGLVKLIDLEKKEVIKKYGEQAKENKIIQIHKMNLSNIDFFLILRETSLLLLDNELNEIAQTKIEASPIKCFITKDHQIYIVHRNRKIIEINYDENENQFSKQQQINQDDFPALINEDKYVTSAALFDETLLLITYFGGPPSVFNLKTKSLHWQARNVKNDELDLQVKMYDYDGLFMDENTIVVITVHKTFRTYSILKPKSQPIYESKIAPSQTKAVQIRSHDEKYTVVNERGEILIFNKALSFERSIKGTFGAIRDLIIHKDYIYTVGLDRFLRVYHLDDVKTPLSINLSQRLTAVNFNEIEEKEIIIEKKEVPVWNIRNGKEAKARFQGMRKNTIKLPYLEQMFMNHKLRKVKVEEQQIKQEEKAEINEKQEEQHTRGIQNKKIEKLKTKQRIVDLKKNKQLVNKPKKNKK